MNLRNRIAFYFVSRLFWLFIIWGLLIGLSIILFHFFIGNDQQGNSQLSMNNIVEHTVVKNQELSVNTEIKEDLQHNHMWLQVLDEDGYETFAFNKPETVQDHYAPGELVADYIYPANKEYELSTWYDTVNNQELTWVLGKPITNHNPFLYWANNLWMLSIIAIGIIIALFFGKQLSAPILYMVSWVENLSKEKYEKPSYHSKRRRQSKAEYKTFQELTQALSRLTSTLKRNQVEREMLEETREEWMTGVSHDLKTPLSTIKGYTAILASDAYDWKQEEVRHFANTMEERVAYMEQLIEDFSLTFQLKNDAIPLQLEKGNVVDVIQNLLKQLQGLPEARNNRISFETNSEQISLHMDTKYLKRAFENLIANSMKHNPPETSIAIKLYEDHSGKIHIVIEDDGIGMDQETVDHLFDRYFRGTNNASDTSGTGLGMAIARQIIFAHGGDIVIKSKPHLGTQCHIIFPNDFQEDSIS
ncbi:HAMP domain-containing histidine kinase [Virgibacillus sp. NKC19-3]|uniref:sensor histidine kinase n=1 Tax=Virgibacillus saliphilus TaxID=2831674 RepID=UPI001C9B4721|nr:HAMP domain-containing sensor histidine kinase [Virgibacillus sp. NKC19-3]MBY7141895.1 HAMP domain-containing histidine kinase [Virgibacillus sp. NKC19-3]